MSVVVVTGSPGLIESGAVAFFCEKRFDVAGRGSRIGDRAGWISGTAEFEKHYPTWQRQISPGATISKFADAVSQRQRRAG